MQFDTPRRTRSMDASIVPMINVVFLLLIFFLMTAQIAPPDPVQVTPPEAGEAEQAGARDAIYLDARGTLALAGARGPAAVVAALQARDDPRAPVLIRADAGAPAQDLAQLMARLSALELRGIELVAVPR